MSWYQIVIPEDVRRELHLSPGQEFDIVALNGRLHVLPARLAEHYAPARATPADVVVLTVCLLEVGRVTYRERGEEAAAECLRGAAWGVPW